MKAEFTARIAGLFWAASFFLSLGILPTVEPERLAGVLLGVAAVGLLVASGGDLHRRAIAAPHIALFFLLFWLLAVASAAWSVAPYISVIGLGGFTIVPATILAVLFARPDLRAIFLRFAVWGTGIVVAGISLWALVQVFLLPEFLVSGQVRHPFPNPNAYAALLSLSFFAGLGLFLKETDPKIRAALWVGLFLALCAFSAIAGKAATLGMLVGIIILIVASGRVFLPQQWKPLLGMGLAVTGVSVAMAMMPDKKNVVSLLSGMLTGETGTIENRIDIWRSTIDLIAAHPWLGTGYRTFSLMYPSVRRPEDVFSSGWMVHSDPLQFWQEMGLLGPVLFYAIGIAVLIGFIRFWRKGGGAPLYRVFILSLFLGCGAFITHSHVDFLFYTLPTMMAFALALPALVVSTSKPAEVMPLSFMAGWPEGLRLLAVFTPVLAVIALHIPVMAGEIYTVKAGRLIREGDMEGFAAAVNKANKIGMGWNARPYTMAATVPLSILKNQSATMSLEEQQALFRQIDGLLSQALKRNSRLASAWYHRGDMVNYLNDDILPPGYWTAEDCFTKALTIDPLNLPSRVALADVYQTSGRVELALDVLLAGIDRPYPVTDPTDYFNRTEILARALKRDDAVPKILHAREYHMARVEGARQRKAALDRVRDNNIFIP